MIQAGSTRCMLCRAEFGDMPPLVAAAKLEILEWIFFFEPAGLAPPRAEPTESEPSEADLTEEETAPEPVEGAAPQSLRAEAQPFYPAGVPAALQVGEGNAQQFHQYMQQAYQYARQMGDAYEAFVQNQIKWEWGHKSFHISVWP